LNSRHRDFQSARRLGARGPDRARSLSIGPLTRRRPTPSVPGSGRSCPLGVGKRAVRPWRTPTSAGPAGLAPGRAGRVRRHVGTLPAEPRSRSTPTHPAWTSARPSSFRSTRGRPPDRRPALGGVRRRCRERDAPPSPNKSDTAGHLNAREATEACATLRGARPWSPSGGWRRASSALLWDGLSGSVPRTSPGASCAWTRPIDAAGLAGLHSRQTR
jgi:hypothetical protein